MKLQRTALLIVCLISNAELTAQTVLEPKRKIFVGTGACNNGTVTTDELYLTCTTKPLGFTIDDASASPGSDYVLVRVGVDVPNNGVVTPNANHAGGATQPIGYLSKKPVKGGTSLQVGTGPCNNGEVTVNEKHKGCATEFLGYALPNQ
jgi:hypothetical protein